MTDEEAKNCPDPIEKIHELASIVRSAIIDMGQLEDWGRVPGDDFRAALRSLRDLIDRLEESLDDPQGRPRVS